MASGVVGSGGASCGKAVKVSLGEFRYGGARQSRFGLLRSGLVGWAEVRHGSRGKARSGIIWHVMVRHGSLGALRYVLFRQAEVRQSRSDLAWFDSICSGALWCGQAVMVGLGTVRPSGVSSGKAV